MGGLPPEALDVPARTMARICEDPYDRLFSMAVREEDPQERMAELGDAGFTQFTVDEAAGLVRRSGSVHGQHPGQGRTLGRNAVGPSDPVHEFGLGTWSDLLDTLALSVCRAKTHTLA